LWVERLPRTGDQNFFSIEEAQFEIHGKEPGRLLPESHRLEFRFLAASTRRMIETADTSSASQILNNVSTVGDLRFRSSWLM
jgi:hypothetical protein